MPAGQNGRSLLNQVSSEKDSFFSVCFLIFNSFGFWIF